MRHGILIINKERGKTSHQVVAELRRILKQSDVGHSGTLDPEAEGVLVLGLGQATRSFSFLEETVKVYRAEIVLGQETDTQDATGSVLAENPGASLTISAILEAIAQLTGTIEQIPPMYSAVKLKGQKLYDLARQGLVVERQSRLVTVFNWTVEDPMEKYKFKERLTSTITCSKGTYVRTLIHDLGKVLGCGAHMGGLIRLQSGNFHLEDSLTLDQVREHVTAGNLDKLILPMERVLDHLPTLYLQNDDVVKVKNGGKISFYKYGLETVSGSLVKAMENCTQKVIAVLRLEDNGSYHYWQPAKVFRYDEN